MAAPGPAPERDRESESERGDGERGEKESRRETTENCRETWQKENGNTLGGDCLADCHVVQCKSVYSI